ncbi:hypothetical protein EOD39_20619 [Acipenser ruthenus]|uniref:TRIM8/14/16/25/29/45/65 coiled-coil region domain-containing protein n=1 Tax=Acipenser ruthenus TaxID=7906 RepID=A0A444UUZ2_ACIRT|nr:hypothetical protein EOD39_20619 [Acipenser ruthenus]
MSSFTQKSEKMEQKKSEKLFTELIQSIEKTHTEVIELIGAIEKAAVNQAEGLMKKLEQEIAELIKINTELQQLSESEDRIYLQNFQSLCAPPEAGDLPSITVNFGAVKKAVSELKDHIEDFCKLRPKNMGLLSVSLGTRTSALLVSALRCFGAALRRLVQCFGALCLALLRFGLGARRSVHATSMLGACHLVHIPSALGARILSARCSTLSSSALAAHPRRFSARCAALRHSVLNTSACGIDASAIEVS